MFIPRLHNYFRRVKTVTLRNINPGFNVLDLRSMDMGQNLSIDTLELSYPRGSPKGLQNRTDVWLTSLIYYYRSIHCLKLIDTLPEDLGGDFEAITGPDIDRLELHFCSMTVLQLLEKIQSVPGSLSIIHKHAWMAKEVTALNEFFRVSGRELEKFSMTVLPDTRSKYPYAGERCFKYRQSATLNPEQQFPST